MARCKVLRAYLQSDYKRFIKRSIVNGLYTQRVVKSNSHTGTSPGGWLWEVLAVGVATTASPADGSVP